MRLAYEVGIGDGFWSMTLAEFRLAVQGHSKRRESEQLLLAWHACHLLAPHLKKGKKLSPMDLVGREPEPMPFTSPEDFDARMKDRMRAKSLRRAAEARGESNGNTR